MGTLLVTPHERVCAGAHGFPDLAAAISLDMANRLPLVEAAWMLPG